MLCILISQKKIYICDDICLGARNLFRIMISFLRGGGGVWKRGLREGERGWKGKDGRMAEGWEWYYRVRVEMREIESVLVRLQSSSLLICILSTASSSLYTLYPERVQQNPNFLSFFFPPEGVFFCLQKSIYARARAVVLL